MHLLHQKFVNKIVTIDLLYSKYIHKKSLMNLCEQVNYAKEKSEGSGEGVSPGMERESNPPPDLSQ